MEDRRGEIEKRLNEEAAAPHLGMWRGNNAENLRRLKSAINPTEDLSEKLAAAAKERGRPLTQTEIALVGEGKPLPAIVTKEREKSMEENFADLQERVAALEIEPEQRSATTKRR